MTNPRPFRPVASFAVLGMSPVQNVRYLTGPYPQHPPTPSPPKPGVSFSKYSPNGSTESKNYTDALRNQTINQTFKKIIIPVPFFAISSPFVFFFEGFCAAMEFFLLARTGAGEVKRRSCREIGA